MKTQIFSLLAASVAASVSTLAGGAPAMAASDGVQALSCQSGYFCAYINVNYNGQLLKSQAGRGSQVQVGGGTSSGSNNTANLWVGVNEIPSYPDDDIFKWAPYTEANLGSAQNDKINYFNVK